MGNAIINPNYCNIYENCKNESNNKILGEMKINLLIKNNIISNNLTNRIIEIYKSLDNIKYLYKIMEYAFLNQIQEILNILHEEYNIMYDNKKMIRTISLGINFTTLYEIKIDVKGMKHLESLLKITKLHDNFDLNIIINHIKAIENITEYSVVGIWESTRIKKNYSCMFAGLIKYMPKLKVFSTLCIIIIFRL